ncbi:transposase [Natronococcus sp.]|uniref:transposase n=1 Tax=Natronococcus sp. TaxID=35747 RepID=UPI003A4D783C
MSAIGETKIPGSTAGFYGSWLIDEPEYVDWTDYMVCWGVKHTGSGSPGIEDLIGALDVRLNDWRTPHDEYEDFPDDRADWHRNFTPLLPWIRAHVLRLVKGWRSKKLSGFLRENPNLALKYGFRKSGDGLGRYTADAPKQSRLWEMWHKEFPEILREACRKITEDVVTQARHRDIPVPDPVFRPKERNSTSEPSKRQLRIKRTREVWQQAKPFVTDTFSLKRADNAEIHENAFWENQAYCGMREEMYAQDGSDNFAADTSRDRVPSGSNHRHQVQKLGVDEVRSMLRETTRMLVARARRNSELSGDLWAAIDITKGNPWHGEVERDDDGSLEEPYILGYKDNEIYFQWATIQIVGLDIPLVLDAIPVRRGMSKNEIVDELLEGGLDAVGDIELVMMDREFDSEAVKDVCERHDVYYLNPARKHSSERAMCTKLREAGKKVRVEEQKSLQGTTRKRMYLPARNTDVFEPEDPELVDEDADQPDHRQEMVDEFVEIGGDADELEESPIDGLLDDMREEEEPKRGKRADIDAYALFETNHPALSADAGSEEALLEEVRGFIKRYGHRWGIENGYKKLKQFRVRTTSKQHQYRYFNFAFACVLYNVWRLVDLLVKLELEDEPDYTPFVSADQFLTEAKKFFGLDPPD